MSDPNCIFCKIASGAIPAKHLAESEHALAFPDLNPQAPTHVLIIPKLHVESHAQVTDMGVLASMHALAQQVAQEMKLVNGYRLIVNTGRESGQTVFHLHMHLLGGRPMTWPPG